MISAAYTMKTPLGDVPRTAGIRCESILDATYLEAAQSDLEELYAHALHSNPAYSFPVLKAALTRLSLSHEEAPTIVAVWLDEVADEPVLVGLFAYHVEPDRWQIPMTVAHGWTHLFEFLGTPLVHRDYAEQALEGFFTWIDGGPHLLLEKLPCNGPLMSALKNTAELSGRSMELFDRHERAAYDARGDAQEYVNKALERKRRKEWRRLRRRLSEAGNLEFFDLHAEDDVAAWCDAFFALEKSGWKGRAGTAIACDREAEAFMREALCEEGARGRLDFWTLTLDDEPIAMAFALKQPPEAWLMKIAYDENFSQFSPGALLVFDIMEAMSADQSVKIVDSCAMPEHPMIDHLWRERIEFADVLLSKADMGPAGFRMLCGLETTRRKLRETAKNVYRRLVNHRPKTGASA